MTVAIAPTSRGEAEGRALELIIGEIVRDPAWGQVTQRRHVPLFDDGTARSEKLHLDDVRGRCRRTTVEVGMKPDGSVGPENPVGEGEMVLGRTHRSLVIGAVDRAR